jgi:hypothetical protein
MKPRSRFLGFGDASSAAPCVAVTQGAEDTDVELDATPQPEDNGLVTPPPSSPMVSGPLQTLKSTATSPAPASASSADATPSRKRKQRPTAGTALAHAIEGDLYLFPHADSSEEDALERKLVALLADPGSASISASEALASIDSAATSVVRRQPSWRLGAPTSSTGPLEPSDVVFSSAEVLESAPPAPLPGKPVGHFSCGSPCGAWLDCGLHRCPEPCHPGDCNGCALLPSRLARCACGQTPLSELVPPHSPLARASCLDPVPTCSKPCSKALPCGHACAVTCHTGPCPPCVAAVPVTCRCGSSASASAAAEQSRSGGPSSSSGAAAGTMPCDELYRCAAAGGDPQTWMRLQREPGIALAKAPSHPPVPLEELRSFPLSLVASSLLRCHRVCGRKLACGRHRCTRVCCPLMHKEDGGLGAPAGASSSVRILTEFQHQ